jgi:D-amino peptidase
LIKRVLLLADIEGSSHCWSRDGARFMTEEWIDACIGMSRDADAVCRALFDAGVEKILLKDFHRTGYNLLAERIDARAKLVPGFRSKPVPGIGDPEDTQVLIMIGMHAASGTPGFLAHTFTSRIRRLSVNGADLPEAAFFAGAVARYGIRPVFFSGCPVACRQAEAVIGGIRTHSIDKSVPRRRFDASAWRRRLAAAAASSLAGATALPYAPRGPFHTQVTMRGGSARTLAGRWGLGHASGRIVFEAPDLDALYMTLIRLCYLHPLAERVLPAALFGFHLKGRLGMRWLRHRMRSGRGAALP